MAVFSYKGTLLYADSMATSVTGLRILCDVRAEAEEMVDHQNVLCEKGEEPKKRLIIRMLSVRKAWGRKNGSSSECYLRESCGAEEIFDHRNVICEKGEGPKKWLIIGMVSVRKVRAEEMVNHQKVICEKGEGPRK
jgi:hypothetical protein